MRSLLLRCVLPLLLGMLALPASAGIILVAHLSTDQEPPGTVTLTQDNGVDPRPESFGEAQFLLNDAHTLLTMMVTVFNIDVTGTQTPNVTNDNLVAAHIHAFNGPIAPTAPVRWGFFGSPDNDNLAPELVLTPFSNGVGGTFVSAWNQPEGNNGTTLTAQLPFILQGLSYINFHTVQNPRGEIRGQLLIPEPATLLLLGFGMALLAAQRRRR